MSEKLKMERGSGNIFLDIVGVAGCRTFNCTEGGTLFGDGVEFVTLKEFLEREKGGGAHVASV